MNEPKIYIKPSYLCQKHKLRLGNLKLVKGTELTLGPTTEVTRNFHVTTLKCYFTDTKIYFNKVLVNEVMYTIKTEKFRLYIRRVNDTFSGSLYVSQIGCRYTVM